MRENHQVQDQKSEHVGVEGRALESGRVTIIELKWKGEHMNL